MIRKLAWTFAEALLDLIYPSNIYCICCNKPIQDTVRFSICPQCMEEIRWAFGKTCAKCGKPLQDWYYPSICTDCTINRHFFERGFTCVFYGEKEKKIVYDIKYNQKAYIAAKIAEIMKERLKSANINPDCILPVPMHKMKLKERGYNQAEILSVYLSELTGIEYKNNILLRIKNTEPMSRLSLSERKNNLRNAFAVEKKEKIKGKRILLVDDVYTTGSTADECSKALLAAGAETVWVLTFASGEN